MCVCVCKRVKFECLICCTLIALTSFSPTPPKHNSAHTQRTDVVDVLEGVHLAPLHGQTQKHGETSEQVDGKLALELCRRPQPVVRDLHLPIAAATAATVGARVVVAEEVAGGPQQRG